MFDKLQQITYLQALNESDKSAGLLAPLSNAQKRDQLMHKFCNSIEAGLKKANKPVRYQIQLRIKRPTPLARWRRWWLARSTWFRDSRSYSLVSVPVLNARVVTFLIWACVTLIGLAIASTAHAITTWIGVCAATLLSVLVHYACYTAHLIREVMIQSPNFLAELNEATDVRVNIGSDECYQDGRRVTFFDNRFGFTFYDGERCISSGMVRDQNKVPDWLTPEVLEAALSDYIDQLETQAAAELPAAAWLALVDKKETP
jgi:hypothetical protein